MDKTERLRQWRLANPDKVRAYHAKQRAEHPERHRARNNEANNRLRDAVFEAYGPNCRCCGESVRVFLTLDHIDNDGNEHRKAVGSGVAVYRDLRKRGFPPGYQVLCANCNMVKARGITCPHQQK